MSNLLTSTFRLPYPFFISFYYLDSFDIGLDVYRQSVKVIENRRNEKTKWTRLSVLCLNKISCLGR